MWLSDADRQQRKTETQEGEISEGGQPIGAEDQEISGESGEQMIVPPLFTCPVKKTGSAPRSLFAFTLTCPSRNGAKCDCPTAGGYAIASRPMGSKTSWLDLRSTLMRTCEPWSFERVELQQEFGDCREGDPEVFPFGRGNNSVKV